MWIFNAYTFDFMNPNTEKSRGVKSEEDAPIACVNYDLSTYWEFFHRGIPRTFLSVGIEQLKEPITEAAALITPYMLGDVFHSTQER